MANPSKKGASKAEGSTLTNHPNKKPTTKAAAPKPTAKAPTTKPANAKETAKASTTKKATTANATKATSVKPATKKVPTKKSEKKEAAAKATAAATKATPAPSTQATMSGEKPKPHANTSRKRRAPSIDGEDEAPAATISKKLKADTSNLKRKATVDAGEKPKKAAKITRNDIAKPKDSKQKTTAKPPAASAKKPTNKAVSQSAKAPAAAKSTGRTTTASKVRKAQKAPAAKLKTRIQINFAPTQPLDIFIFGSGESGELGLGNRRVDGKKPVNVRRPRIHPFLSAETVGVVQIACGGMHSVALTKDNKILTWGVNDQGALGRDTTWDGGLRDADANADDNSGNDFEALNPIECTPAEVSTKNIVDGTKFVKVVASDSASFALTVDGRVYGWGTFRSSDGILGFTKDVLVQYEPALLEDCKKIVDIAVGNNHVMTLDNKGKVETWGAPEQNQLGRRVVQRDMKASALRPGGLSFKRGIKIAKIACGSYHSFAIDDLGRLYSWGLNNFGELGLDQNAGEDDATVLEPTLVESLADYSIAEVSGGEHHSIACTDDGRLLAWGRIDGNQTGLTADKFNDANTIFDEHEKPRILSAPTVHEGFPAVASVACGTDNSFAITREGKAYSWGFSANYQTGQGEQDDDVEVPTLIDNSAVHDRKILSAGAGGQFSVLTSIHQNA
ncbi:rcc1 domain-containing protein [Diaporthe amygdali]|uniref:rcc1 domain-containing protein n=1 Tax=Phomopsis amygdali TaxID=1214568 RepID=UPI0022FE0548|nr:rcc1 domain-containing protein [Diaporthe amygdali]KAJ0119583.1 rcc1 domain-containing protein [Diaporthe amygdali]